MTTRSKLAALIVSKRDSLNMTQSMLAQAAGLSVRTVIRAENGEKPSAETLSALCSVLGIPSETARAAINADIDAGPTVLLPPAMGPEIQAVHRAAIRTALRLNPTASHVAGFDVAAYLSATLNPDDLNKAFVPAPRQPETTHSRWAAHARASNPLPARAFLRILDGVPEGMPRNLLGGFLLALLFAGLASLMTLRDIAANAPSLELAANAGTAFLAVVAAWAVLTIPSVNKSLRTNLLVSRLARRVVCVSPDLLVVTDGDDVEEIAALDCESVEIVSRPDETHLTVEISTVGRSVRLEWLPNDQSLRLALSRFRSVANATATTASARAVPA